MTEAAHAVPPGARATLSDWLKRAEELLQSQRAASISPSFAAAVAAGVPSEAEMPFSAVEEGLEPLLDRLVKDPGRWILILEFGPSAANLYVQFLVFEDGSLVAEVVSNIYLEAPFKVTKAQHAVLELLGWGAPVPGRRTNWIMVEESRTPNIEDVAHCVVETLYQVFDLDPGDAVRCKLFSSPIRGNTPASERPTVTRQLEDEDETPDDDLFRALNRADRLPADARCA
jgi:T3SS (YopN, CesT) and YbjN peptide-binding chaperone 3